VLTRCRCVAALALLSSTPAGAGGRVATPLPPADPAVYLDRSGVEELVIGQALLGVIAGSAAGWGAVGTPDGMSSGAAVGLAAGVGLPLLLTRGRPVPAAHAQYVNTLEWIGMLNGLLAGMAAGLEPGELSQRRAWYGLTAGSGALGLGVAALTVDVLQPSPGQVGALLSGAAYGAYTGVTVLGLADIVDDTQEAGVLLLAFTDAGVLAALLLRDHLDVGRSRMLWLDIGGLGGMVIGSGLLWTATGQRASPEVVAGSMLAGFWGGVLAAWVATARIDRWRERADVASASVLRIDPDAGVVLGSVLPRIATFSDPRAAGGRRLELSVGLLEGRF